MATVLEDPISDGGRVIRPVVLEDASAVMEILWDAEARAWVVPAGAPPLGWDKLPFLPQAPDRAARA